MPNIRHLPFVEEHLTAQIVFLGFPMTTEAGQTSPDTEEA